MSVSQITAVGIRLFAVWVVLYVLSNAPAMWRFNISEGITGANFAIVVGSLLLLLVAAAMWFFPLGIARLLVPRGPRGPEQSTSIPGSFAQVEALAFCLLGLWVLAEVVPEAFYWIFMSYHASRLEAQLDLGVRDWSMMAVTVVKVVIGIWLVLGAKGLRGLLHRARTSGT